MAHTPRRAGIVGLLIVGLVGTSGLAGASGSHVTLQLAHNISPVPNFDNPVGNPCSTQPTNQSGACDSYLLAAINRARRVEGVSTPMVLPSNWGRLSVTEQLFVLADLERVGRGLPPYLGLNRALSANAADAAAHDADPTVAKGFPVGLNPAGWYGVGGTWAGGDTWSTLEADYLWMYNDGWGGKYGTENYDCVSATSKGCWGHREELLGWDPQNNAGAGLGCTNCEMGTGFAMVHGMGSYVDLIEKPAGVAPAMYFTWSRDVRPYLKRVTTVATPTSMADYVTGDPLPYGTPVLGKVLARYASRVQSGLNGLGLGASVTADAAWVEMGRRGLDVAVTEASAFAHSPTPGTPVSAVTAICSALSPGSVATSTVTGLAHSAKARCAGANVVSWSVANVLGVVVVSGTATTTGMAESSALIAASTMPPNGVVAT